MSETPIYKFPVPDDEDAPDGPVQIDALAKALEGTAWKPANLSTGATVNAALEMVAPTTNLIHMGIGTGTVKKIAAGKNGQVLSIYFAAAVKVENGTGNIVLAQTGTFTAASGEVLTLVYNEAASAWVEVGRSVLPDAAVTSRKAKLTVGEVAATESFVPASGVATAVPGAELKITPAVSSNLLIWAFWTMTTSGVGSTTTGLIEVDGKNLTRAASRGVGGGTDIFMELTIPMNYVVPLTAGAHTIKQLAQISGGSRNVTKNTGFAYALVAA